MSTHGVIATALFAASAFGSGCAGIDETLDDEGTQGVQVLALDQDGVVGTYRSTEGVKLAFERVREPEQNALVYVVRNANDVALAYHVYADGMTWLSVNGARLDVSDLSVDKMTALRAEHAPFLSSATGKAVRDLAPALASDLTATGANDVVPEMVALEMLSTLLDLVANDGHRGYAVNDSHAYALPTGDGTCMGHSYNQWIYEDGTADKMSDDLPNAYEMPIDGDPDSGGGGGSWGGGCRGLCGPGCNGLGMNVWSQACADHDDVTRGTCGGSHRNCFSRGYNNPLHYNFQQKGGFGRALVSVVARVGLTSACRYFGGNC